MLYCPGLASNLVHRPDVKQGDFLAKGLETRQKIYRGVGNPEVHWMLKRYFPDMSITNSLLNLSPSNAHKFADHIQLQHMQQTRSFLDT